MILTEAKSNTDGSQAREEDTASSPCEEMDVKRMSSFLKEMGNSRWSL